MKRRQTLQRKLILAHLSESRKHATAFEIYRKLNQRIKGLTLATVYRNLLVLKEDGLIQEIYSDKKAERFEFIREPHSHLICESCGQIVDFKMPAGALAKEIIKSETGLDIHYERIDFFGTCKKCQKKLKKTKQKKK